MADKADHMADRTVASQSSATPPAAAWLWRLAKSGAIGSEQEGDDDSVFAALCTEPDERTESDVDCLAAWLARYQLCSNQALNVESICRTMRLEPAVAADELICFQGDALDSMYIVYSGRCAEYRASDEVAVAADAPVVCSAERETVLRQLAKRRHIEKARARDDEAKLLPSGFVAPMRWSELLADKQRKSARVRPPPLPPGAAVAALAKRKASTLVYMSVAKQRLLSAVRLQAAVRGRAARQATSEASMAASASSHEAYVERKRAAVAMEAHARGTSARQLFRCQRSAATHVQARTRGIQARDKVKELRAVETVAAANGAAAARPSPTKVYFRRARTLLEAATLGETGLLARNAYWPSCVVAERETLLVSYRRACLLLCPRSSLPPVPPAPSTCMHMPAPMPVVRCASMARRTARSRRGRPVRKWTRVSPSCVRFQRLRRCARGELLVTLPRPSAALARPPVPPPRAASLAHRHSSLV